MSKWIIIVVLVLLVVAGGFAYSALNGGLEVQSAAARLGRIEEFVDERGTTRLPHTYLITMPYEGRIEPITLDEGSKVAAGQVVARIVPLDLKLVVDAAQAAVDRLDASIRENDDISVETTAHKQSQKFLESMDATVDAALNRVRAGKRKFEFAETQLNRVRPLVPTGQATQEQLERAEVEFVQASVDLRQDELVYSAMLSLRAATAMVPTMIQQYIDRKNLSRAVLVQQREEAKAKLEQVLADQRRGTMTSPVDGVVLARHVSNERHLAAGTVLLEIGNLADLEVEAEVLSQDVVRVKRGQRAIVYGPAIGEPTAEARVARIFPAGFTKVSSLGVEQQRVNIIVRFLSQELSRLVNQQGLGVDYRVQVRVITAEKDNVLVIPRSALFRAADGHWEVFIIRDGRARRAPLTIGLENDSLAEVKEGLSDGDMVILAPSAQLQDGTRVRAVTAPQ